MGSGYAACKAVIVSKEFLEKEFNKEWLLFMAAIEQDEGNGLCELSHGECSNSQLEEAYEALESAFNAKHPSLAMYVIYHNSEDKGDRYDELDGWAIGLDGVYEYTPEARKISEHLSDVNYVVFG